MHIHPNPRSEIYENFRNFSERTPPDKVRKIIFFGDFSHIASVKERIFLHIFLNLL